MKEKTLDIYTDASGSTDKYGFGILFIENERETSFNYKSNINLLKKEFNIKDNRPGTTSVSEAYAIMKALQNIRKKYNKITLYTDNYHVFAKLNGLTKRLRSKKFLLFNKIIEKCQFLMKDLNIEIRHIKAHCGVYGNEIVDKLSKKANKSKRMPYCNSGVDPIKLYTFEFNNSFILDEITFNIDEIKK